MMGDERITKIVEVIQFPTRAVRDSAAIERTLRQILNQCGASPDMIEEVCSRTKDYFEKLNIDFGTSCQLPPLPEGLKAVIQDSINQGLKKLFDQIHEYTSKILYDRVCLEIELYTLRHEEPDKP